MANEKHIAAGTKVTVAKAIDVPQWSEWDDDKGRTSIPTKRRLQQLFFRGDKKVTSEIVYIAKESERDQLRRQGRVKVRIRDSSGAAVVVTADAESLKKA